MTKCEKTQELRDCLDQAWTVFLESMGYFIIPLANSTKNIVAYMKALQLDMIILSGGNDLQGVNQAVDVSPLRDDIENKIINFAENNGIPLLGVCRGMQMLNRYYGGTLSMLDGHVATKHKVAIIDKEHALWPEAFKVNSYHRYGIHQNDLAQCLMPLVIADDGTIEAVKHNHYNFWGIMWHPERNDIMQEYDRLLMECILDKQHV